MSLPLFYNVEEALSFVKHYKTSAINQVFWLEIWIPIVWCAKGPNFYLIDTWKYRVEFVALLWLSVFTQEKKSYTFLLFWMKLPTFKNPQIMQIL